MLKPLLHRRTLYAAFLAAAAMASAAPLAPAVVAAPDSPGRVEPGITHPSDKRDLTFSVPGLVTEVTVKDGDAVEAGAVIAQQDVSVETASKAVYDIKANSTVEEEYAKADAAQKRVELKRKENLAKTGNANALEVEEARLAVARADASVKLAGQERQVAKAQAEGEQKRIDLKRLISPVKGVVQRLETRVGEVYAGNANNTPAVRVVQNDPLWVEAKLAIPQVAAMKLKEKLQVRYPGETDWRDAEIIFLDPEADPASDTRLVRMVMPNPEQHPAGLQVQVKLPEAAVAAGAPVERGARAGAGR
jgi:multidrug efflux pump subunit AcrA (membrane-fusion protein)